MDLWSLVVTDLMPFFIQSHVCYNKKRVHIMEDLFRVSVIKLPFHIVTKMHNNLFTLNSAFSYGSLLATAIKFAFGCLRYTVCGITWLQPPKLSKFSAVLSCEC